MKTTNRNYIIFTALALFLIGSGIIGGLALKINTFIHTPINQAADKQVFVISPGQSLSVIAANLQAQSLISNDWYFKLYAKAGKADKKLQAGEYILSAAQSPRQIMATLVSGKVRLYKITIPEGFTIAEISRLMEKEGLCSAASFSKLCNDQELISSYGISASSLEGYLFPNTYFFPKHTACETIVRSMVDQFFKIITKEWETRAKALKLSLHEVVTLASIIEKETGDPGERPLISSVFHNRLKKKMRLESDPTVIYGIEDFDGNIKRKHLRMLTPYNTYKIRGLPVGPIANPGAKAIEAALYPDKSDYLFFVSKKDTTHYFSKTIEEHNRAVRKYQLRR